ncbi:Gfo/Idh/MocA family oxidoreductase [Photobacterium galatheae]|uniref:Gfo/Idh/MocA family oxidoreductase n=1 Tax=Photobacterium galatheae TaxID=1654360 RepID=UPI00202D0630|nr:Gfo/Idh/MocA family oxidoreductase [Photobacterium galatheae]MCM0147569.1 Gfo/Idh/MocA family oxidoreductase [Photobacterium galatheae]
MIKVFIIGAGQLGSRHLQGILKSENELSITVIDPSDSSLEIAKQRSREVNFGNPHTEIEFQQTIPTGVEIELCIIATTAKIRAEVTRELVTKNRVKNIVFEKVLFQKLDDYATILDLINKKNIKAWVNCPRRMNSDYAFIKEQLHGQESIIVDVVGTNWGMACNSVHFIDLFFYLSDCSFYSIDDIDLDESIVESKRSSYYEVNGNFEVVAKNSRMRLSCTDGDTTKIRVAIMAQGIKIIISETENEIEILKDNEIIKHPFTVRYQSELSNVFLDSIVSDGNCNLTPLSESCSIHTPFIEMLLKHFTSSLNCQFSECPIT